MSDPHNGRITIMKSTALLRFQDLKKRRIVDNRVQLRRLQERYGFPLGRMLSPNIRVWTVEEVETWLASRPIDNERPIRGVALKRHLARRQAEAAASSDDEPRDVMSNP